ncbi:response regulator [Bowmanella sp. JS7-9]|uniref:DUF3369 domain-containing protein n=1 Tax=Pseudobowmanella zhangzhouensis TaxID=1537679 RepID=A0ABW1XJF9_9ALTE|nr:response regulator [Bowmanella sp. JS7-9]TBX27431.1 hypothetical protein TK45_01415 [Bowmanella sp. JS7-9]
MDDFLFADEQDDALDDVPKKSWKILIVDDEKEIHTVTRLALNDFVFQDRSLEFLGAMSGAEAKQVLAEHDDIAIVLLDVVMETEHAGLDVARYIREELNNYYTRIILRTGQPGQAPERHVIINYDINDYKSKTDLTAQKLFTVIISTLRSYRDIVVIDENRRGLEKIIKASANLFSMRSLERFIEGIVQQLSSLLGGTEEAVYMTAVAGPKPISDIQAEHYYVFSACGQFNDLQGKPLEEVMQGNKLDSCKAALNSKDIVYGEDHVVAYCASKSQRGAILYMSGLQRTLNDLDKHLIDLFAMNVQIAFDNILRSQEIEQSQQLLIEHLANLLANNGHGVHARTRRLKAMTTLLAKQAGMEEAAAQELAQAVSIFDMRHSSELTDFDPCADNTTALGVGQFANQALETSQYGFIRLAAQLANEFREAWDGSGCPNKKQGESIALATRITQIVITLENTVSAEPDMSMPEALQRLEALAGKQLDPELVTLLISQQDAASQIRAEHQ